MDKVSRAVLTMMALAVFGMSLLIAYGVRDMAPEESEKTDAAPSNPVKLPAPQASADDAVDDDVIEDDDEDFGDFGEPVIDLEGADDASLEDDNVIEEDVQTEASEDEADLAPVAENSATTARPADIASSEAQETSSGLENESQ